MVLGHAFSAATLVLVVVPLAARFFGPAIGWALSGRPVDANAVGSAVLLGITVLELVLALTLALRERRASGSATVSLA